MNCCMNCKDRHTHCHTECGRYKAFAEERERQRKKAGIQKAAENAYTEHVIRTADKYRRHKRRK